MRLLYTMVENANDWKSLTSTRDLSRWFLDDEMRFPSGTELADQAGEDIYTQFCWNVEPSSFPVLAHVEVATDYHENAPISDGFTDQRDEDEADQEYCDRAAGRF